MSPPSPGGDGAAEVEAGTWRQTAIRILGDVVLSAGFWYVLVFVDIPDGTFYAVMAVLLAAMIVWRLVRGKPEGLPVEVPYSCGFAAVDGKEVFLVATLHISPKAPQDVEAVIETVHPDITMIELDEERLDRLQHHEVQAVREPKPEDLQPVQITVTGEPPATVLAQRALWNGERSGEVISGTVEFDEGNAYGMQKSEGMTGKIALMRRGSPGGEFVPFMLKAHNAALGGAEAVLVVDSQPTLPVTRIGAGDFQSDLRIAWRTKRLGFPRIPLLLLPRDEGERLLGRCTRSASGASVHASLMGAGDCEAGHGTVHAQFEILTDNYPRRTLGRRLCQACALACSGVAILYGVIQCFAVEVGGEFTRAESFSTAKGIPCVCIDVDMNGVCSRLFWALLPTPCNLIRSAMAWLALPRVLLSILFPPRGHVDVPGAILLQVAGFRLRTWVAFLLAGFLASTVMGQGLRALSLAGERSGEAAGLVRHEDREAAQIWLMLGLELFILPQVYEAVADSRDEAMYQSIVAKSAERSARRMVVVVGAGHANGILHRVRTRGLSAP